ncbi:MAG TPA: sulfatase-like hydrolase/transferase, partial [Sphingobacterium sp.]|nr:sulfatase-like hydrolase/transferase [Sphingobacterium sp.]
WETEGNVPLPENTATVARLLQQQGYHTGIFGKWGLGGPKSGGGPNSQGFDESLCYLDQRKAHDYYPPHLWKNEEKMLLDGNVNNGKAMYSHDLFMDGALQFVRSHTGSPFFLYLPITLPHGRYEGPDQKPYSDEPWSENERHYAAMITRLDGDVGRILALLRELRIEDNTIVFFSSDNGAVRHISKRFASNGVFRGHKTELYEGGLCIPLLVRWPGQIAPGQVTDHLSGFQDFLSTACELAGASIPEHTDGISYLPILQGKQSQKQHDYLYWEYFEYNYNWEKPGQVLPRNYLDAQAVRMGVWKGVRTGLYKDPNAKIELFNLMDDPSETTDLSAKYPEIIKQLQILLDTTRNDVPYFKK